MPTVYAWPGRTTQNSAWVRAKTTGASVRLVVSTSPSLSNPAFYGPAVPTSDGIVSITATSLTPDTSYTFAMEIDGVTDTDTIGSFRTHPVLGEPADFTIAAFSCAGLNPSTQGVAGTLVPNRISNSPAFLNVLHRNPLQLIHMGDIAYYDPGSGVYVADASVATYRRMIDDVFLQPHQHELYRNVATQYAVDDHDGGPNNHDSQFLFIGNARQVYRERVPHYDLTVPDSNFQTWQIARCQFFLLDSRNHRNPNTTPQSTDKTMLGAGQRDAIRNTLENSPAKVAVFLSPSAWFNPAGDDGWESFTHEQQWLIDTIAQTGWTGRVVMVCGDIHALALDTGGNSPGGIPLLQAASMDSSSGSAQSQFDTGPSLPGRYQYGTIRVNDQGGRIDITLTGWIGDSTWRSFTHSVAVEEDDPEPDTIPPLLVPARAQPTVTWLGCDLYTGRIIDELRDATGSFGRRLGTYTSASLTMPIPTGDPRKVEVLRGATTPGHTMAVAVVHNRPVWAGAILVRDAGTDPILQLGAVSLEGYLDRRRVRSHNWVNRDEASVILTGLFRDAESIGGVGRGLGMLVDAPATGTLRDREYVAKDRKTVYAAAREIMALEGGPEWTVDLEWSDITQTRISKIIRVRKRIGRAAASPNVVFTTTANSVFDSRGSSEASYTLREDYSDGKGANYVIAYSSGEGADQPESALALGANLNQNWPIFEDHYQPASALLETTTLDQHARSRLALRQNGATTWRIRTRWDALPRLAADWDIGDDVAWELFGHWHPTGVKGQGRAIGWSLDPEAGLLDLILWTPGEDV